MAACQRSRDLTSRLITFSGMGTGAVGAVKAPAMQTITKKRKVFVIDFVGVFSVVCLACCQVPVPRISVLMHVSLNQHYYTEHSQTFFRVGT
eukprot:m.197632 g.197632  ORF g.197632 m.197632 type:complete len:92 (+) comp39548_c0_seq15:147-422(+)